MVKLKGIQKSFFRVPIMPTLSLANIKIDRDVKKEASLLVDVFLASWASQFPPTLPHIMAA